MPQLPHKWTVTWLIDEWVSIVKIINWILKNSSQSGIQREARSKAESCHFWFAIWFPALTTFILIFKLISTDIVSPSQSVNPNKTPTLLIY